MQYSDRHRKEVRKRGIIFREGDERRREECERRKREASCSFFLSIHKLPNKRRGKKGTRILREEKKEEDEGEKEKEKEEGENHSSSFLLYAGRHTERKKNKKMLKEENEEENGEE